MNIRAVVFDLGNTLWFQARDPDFEYCYGLESAAIEPLLRQWGIAHSADLNRVQEEIWQTAEGWWRDETRRGGLREADLPAIIGEVAARHGVAVSQEQAHEWWRAAWISVVDLGMQLYPDAIDVLRELRAMGIKIAIDSNRPCTADMQMPGLYEIGIGEYVDAMACSGDTGFAKPHPSTFALILDRLGTAAADTVMVGDSCANDMAGAKAIGMIAVRKLNGRYDADPCPDADHSIHDLGELLALHIFGAPTHAAAFATESLTPHDDANEDRY